MVDPLKNIMENKQNSFFPLYPNDQVRILFLAQKKDWIENYPVNAFLS